MTVMATQEPRESALPSTGARILAMAAIVVAGICGGLIGWKVTDLQITDAGVWAGVGGLVGAVIGAGGVGVVAVLVMRAMGEWNVIQASGDPTAARRGRS
jgi:D-arabinose 1-dehydrogenase-like Zn-dependent alcohol dehydrogenase